MIKLSKDVKFLVGKKLFMRPIMPQDLPYFVKWINDKETLEMLSAYLPVTIKEEAEWIESLSNKNHTDIQLAIVTTDGNLIGSMGIHKIDWKNRTASTGAFIGDKNYWGKGYGTEAKMLLLNYAFNTLNLRKIYSSAIEYNKRSIAYQMKCGYKIEGRRIKQHFRKGRYWDEILTAVFKKDWLPIWKEYKKQYLE
jgi:RimJ/RimL family protein N-acetyltransferase